MKKFAILAAAAAIGSFAWNASALPDGYESFHLAATLMIQNEGTITEVKFTDKDVLKLIEMEFDITFPAGSRLVTYGLDSYFDERCAKFAVLGPGDDVLLANASYNDDGYELFFQPDEDSYVYDIIDSDDSEEVNLTFDDGDFYYESGGYDDGVAGAYEDEDEFYFYLEGRTQVRDKYTEHADKEWFHMMDATGEFELLNSDEDEIYGVITGWASGYGKDVDTWWEDEEPVVK